MLVATDVFLDLARAEAEAYGYGELPILVLPHPLGIRREEEVRRLAEEKAQELAELWNGPGEASTPHRRPDATPGVVAGAGA